MRLEMYNLTHPLKQSKMNEYTVLCIIVLIGIVVGMSPIMYLHIFVIPRQSEEFEKEMDEIHDNFKPPTDNIGFYSANIKGKEMTMYKNGELIKPNKD